MILKNVVLEDLNQLQCWSDLMGEPIKIGSLYRSPFRADPKPGCKFFMSDGNILFMDHSRNECHNVASAYSKLNHCTYFQALQRLYMRDTEYKRIPVIVEQPCKIKVQSREYSQEFLDYWKYLGVERWQLEREETRTLDVSFFTTSFENFQKKFYPNDLVIAYKHLEKIKVYFPHRQKPRFKSNMGKEDVWEVVNTNEWIISKSHKDLLVLEGMFGNQYSYSMVQNEGSFPIRKSWEQARRLIVLMDNDPAGIMAAEKIKDYYINAECFFIQEAKDPSDLINLKGLEEATHIINKLISI